MNQAPRGIFSKPFARNRPLIAIATFQKRQIPPISERPTSVPLVVSVPDPPICVISAHSWLGSVRGFQEWRNGMIFCFEKSLANCETSGHAQPPFCKQTTEEKL
jgi:hypothetical protein